MFGCNQLRLHLVFVMSYLLRMLIPGLAPSMVGASTLVVSRRGGRIGTVMSPDAMGPAMVGGGGGGGKCVLYGWLH